MSYVEQEKQNFLEEKSKYFPKEKLQAVSEIINGADDDIFEIIYNMKLKKPSTAVLLGFLCLDRFMFKQGVLGVIKLLTYGGLGIWWLIDIFTASKRAKEYNFSILNTVVSNRNAIPTGRDKLENFKNNKELQKTLLNGARSIARSAKDLHNTMYID